jgi:hypothetical protein
MDPEARFVGASSEFSFPLSPALPREWQVFRRRPVDPHFTRSSFWPSVPVFHAT